MTAVILLGSVVVISRGIGRMVRDLEQSHLGAVRSLAAAIDASDEYAGEHSDAVRHLVTAIGTAMGLSRDELRELELVATLHDVGKIGILRRSCTSPGRSIPTSWPSCASTRRSEHGSSTEVPRASRIREAVLHKHEHWDGSGYPHGLAGEDIPLYSRIVLACDAYHAMTGDRPYRSAPPDPEARRRLAERSGGQVDPRVVAALLRALPEVAATPVPSDRGGCCVRVVAAGRASQHEASGRRGFCVHGSGADRRHRPRRL